MYLMYINLYINYNTQIKKKKLQYITKKMMIQSKMNCKL